MAAAAPKSVHHEKDVLLFDVFPEEDVTEKELETAIQETRIANLKWLSEFKREEIGFGVWKLTVGCIITDAAVEGIDSAVIDQITALHSKVEHKHGGHHGHHAHGAGHGAASKKLVKSCEFRAFSRVD